MFIGLGFILAIIMGLLGRYVAKEKNRSKAEGFWLGFLFSIFGVIIVALLPTKEKQVSITTSSKDLSGGALTFFVFLAAVIIGLILYYYTL